MKVLTEKEFLKKLCSFPHRKTPSEFGDKAAKFILQEFKKIGTKAKSEPVKDSHLLSYFGAVFLIAAFLLVLVSFFYPNFFIFLAFILALIFFFYLERIILFLIKPLLKNSKNILAVISSKQDKEKILVLSGHYDTGHCFAFTSPHVGGKLARRGLGRVFHKLPPIIKTPFFPLNFALIFSLIFMATRLVGGDLTILAIFQIISLFILFLGCVFLTQMAISPYVPGAFDNGGGVTVIYELAKKLVNNPLGSTEVWCLIPSGEENSFRGMKAFLNRHKVDFNKENSFFINLDGIGEETLFYLVGESDKLGFSHYCDKFLVSLAQNLSGHPQFQKIKPYFAPSPSDTLEVLRRGFRSLGFTSLNKDCFASHYHQMDDTIKYINFDTIRLGRDFIFEILKKIDTM